MGDRAVSGTVELVDTDAPPVKRRGARGLLRRLGSGAGVVFWIALPLLSILAVVGYFTASVALGTTPPFAIVDGQSMRPNFNPGDFVVIKGVAGHEIEVGDVIAIQTPASFVEDRGALPEVVHRVVRIESGPGYIDFITKGDNNPDEDPFLVRPANIRGKVIARYPGLGFPVLFARAEQGRIFLAAIGVALLGYFLIAAIERRQETAELESPRTALEALTQETHENRESLRELVGAVSDYGYHLRSHTQILQSMSAASERLAEVTNGLSQALPNLTPPLRDADLLEYLRSESYVEWSLFVPERAAAVLGRSRERVLADLVRLAALGTLQVVAVEPPALYRYRLSP